MTDEMFYSIYDVHLKHLIGLGILKNVIASKGKQVKVT